MQYNLYRKSIRNVWFFPFINSWSDKLKYSSFQWWTIFFVCFSIFKLWGAINTCIFKYIWYVSVNLCHFFWCLYSLTLVTGGFFFFFHWGLLKVCSYFLLIHFISVFSAPDLKLAIFPKSSGSFQWEIIFRYLGKRSIYCYEVVIVFQGMVRKCVYIYIYF